MNRSFLVNIILLISINLLIKPFYIFGIDRSVQNAVGNVDYGLYFALFNFTFLFQVINDFGIQNFNNRSIAQDHSLLDKYLPNLLMVKAILAFVYLACIFIFARITGYHADLNYDHLILFLGFNWVLTSTLAYLRTNISGLAMYRTDSLLSSVDKLLLIILVGYLLWFYPDQENFKIEWFLYAQTCTLFITNLLAFFLVYRQTNQFKFSFNPSFKLSLLKQSYPFALALFLMTVYTKVDAIMIERMLIDGKGEAGIYASGYRLLDAINMIGFLFASLLLPMFAKMLQDKEDVKPLLEFSLHLIWAGAISLALACFFFSNDIMALLYDLATPYWGKVMGLLMLSFIAMSGNYIFGTLLTANNSLKKMNWIFFICLLLNVGFNLWLIPVFKAEGAALATCATQFFALFAQILLAIKILNLKFGLSIWIRPVIMGGVLILIGNIIVNYSSFSWHVNFLIFILNSIICSFAIGLIRPLAILELIRNNPEN